MPYRFYISLYRCRLDAAGESVMADGPMAFYCRRDGVAASASLRDYRRLVGADMDHSSGRGTATNRRRVRAAWDDRERNKESVRRRFSFHGGQSINSIKS